MKRGIRFLLRVMWAGVLATVLGFPVFVMKIPDRVPDLSMENPADAIVVLTGGAGRISAGADLLKDGRGLHLYISGTHPDVGKREVLKGTGLSATLRNCCVTLDAEAENTRGNARETAHWMMRFEAQRIILVTSAYHLPRSLIEFRALLPTTEIIAWPVQEPHIDPAHWWQSERTATVLFREYLKTLWAWTDRAIGGSLGNVRPVSGVLQQ